MDYFEPVLAEDKEHQIKKDEVFKREFHLYFDEKDNRTSDLQHLRPNGFTEEKCISDFPARASKLALYIRRRRWLDSDGKNIILDILSLATNEAKFSDGFELTKGGKQWQVDYEGNVVQPFLFDNTYYLNYPIGYNEDGEIKYEFADYVKYEVMDRYGIMNRITGEPLTLAIYSDINMLSKDMFEVQEHDSYEWYLLDTKGNRVSKE